MCGALTLPSIYGTSPVCTARAGRSYLGLISGSFPKVAGKYRDEGRLIDWQLISRKKTPEIVFYEWKWKDYSNSRSFFWLLGTFSQRFGCTRHRISDLVFQFSVVMERQSLIIYEGECLSNDRFTHKEQFEFDPWGIVHWILPYNKINWRHQNFHGK